MSLTRRKFLLSSAGLATTALEAKWQADPPGKKPNVLVAVLDDVGFGDLGCYGSEIPTQCIDTLAANGIRFNNFHVTSLCAPTRACLMTGVNAHAAGVGNIAEWGRDHPGYRGWIRDDVKTLAEMLGPRGYGTYAVGKWHLSTVDGRNASGPFDQWPTGRGFDHWYGFHGAAADHWHPELFRNRAAIYPDKSDGYHLTEDLVDRSIAYIQDHQQASPDRPFFLYLAFGACHFPYHVPADYMARHRGRYDAGWDAVRGDRHAKQQAMGVVPWGTVLAPRNEDVPAWADITQQERRFSARTQEAYAAFLHHTDDQLRRLINYLASSGYLDDTIVIVLSDNGAGSWAPPAGRLDVHRVVYIEPETIDELIANIDKVGTEESQPSYAPGWAQASNTPLKYYKGDTFEGGIRAPLIIHWPAGNLPNNVIRDQYHHVTDVAPTLLELIEDPVRNVDGISFAYSFNAPDAATRKTSQHYETGGDRAIWIDGWKAVTQHQKGTRFEDDHWALYHAARDFSEVNDLSEKYPQRLRQMIDAWQNDAERNNVLPLEDDLLSLEDAAVSRVRRRFVFYPGGTRMESRSAPDIFRHDYVLTAEVTLHGAKTNGVLLASGDSMAGYELFMKNGRLHYTYIYTRSKQYRVKSDARIGKGQHVLMLKGRKTGARSGYVEMLVDDVVVGSLDIPEMWEVKSLNAGVRCGLNRGAPVSQAYTGLFEFDGKLQRIIVELET